MPCERCQVMPVTLLPEGPRPAYLIRERTMAGLAAARARGRKGGRPTVWTPEKLEVARSMYASRQHDIAAIARVVGVSRASVYRALSTPSESSARKPESMAIAHLEDPATPSVSM